MAKVILERQGIYCVRNLISGRVYVGSALRIDLRWHLHRATLRAGKHRSIRFQRSWDKHGADAFEWSILELVPEAANLIAREQHWIDALNAADPKVGLNMAPKAGSVLGLKMSPESRARMSVAQRGKTFSDEGRANMAAAARRMRGPQELENMAAAQRGKKASAETRAKLSAQRKGVPKSAAHRAAIGAAHKGRLVSADQRAQRSAAMLAHYAAHPEARERMREVGRKSGALTKGRKMSDEVRAASSAMRKASPALQAVARANAAKATAAILAGAPTRKWTDEQRAQWSAARKGNPTYKAATEAARAAVTPEGRAAGSKKCGDKLRGQPRHDRRAITFEQAEEIRTLRAGGMSYNDLHARFGIAKPQICAIIKMRIYLRP